MMKDEWGYLWGKCHICQSLADVSFCPVCDHWFCDECRRRYWARGLAFVRFLVASVMGLAPRRGVCCGPTEK